MTSTLNDDDPRIARSADRQDRRSDVAELTDNQLVTGVGRADPDAFAELYSRHGGGVRAVARSLCGTAVGDEIAQETFLELWRRPELFDPGRGTLRAFLRMRAHSSAVDHLRSDTARKKREAVDLARTPSTDIDAEVVAVSCVADAEAWRLLYTLPDRLRDPIAMAYFGGRTYREVAALVNQPEGTIKSRIRAGLRQLGAQLRNDQAKTVASTVAPT